MSIMFALVYYHVGRSVRDYVGLSVEGTAVGNFSISFTPLCLCLSEETLKYVGPFHLVSMPGEVKYPTLGVNV